MIIHSDEQWLLPTGQLVGASTSFALGGMQYLNGVHGLSEAQVQNLGIVKMQPKPDETLVIASPDLQNPGEWVLTPRDTPTIMAAFQRVIESKIEAVAAERGYSSAVSCASYKDSTNEAWAAEAAAFIAWRDAVWAYAFQELEKVQLGQRSTPEISEFIAELPQINWPE